MDGGAESKYFMDRRTAHRIMEASAKADNRFKISHRDGVGSCLFAFWAPALSEQEASRRVEEQHAQRKAERWQGSQTDQKERRTMQTLAIADEAAVVPLASEVVTPAASTTARRLLSDIAVTSLKRKCEQRGNQKVQTF